MYMYLLCSSLTYMKTVIWHTRRTRSSVSDHSGIFYIHLFNYITTPFKTHDEQTCISCDDNTLLRRYFDKRTCIYYIVRLFVFIETPYMNIWDDQCDLMMYIKRPWTMKYKYRMVILQFYSQYMYWNVCRMKNKFC